MTFTPDMQTILLDANSEVLRAAAVAAGRSLPATDGIVARQPQLLTDAPTLLSAPDAQAVTATVTGVGHGSVTLVVADDLAVALRSGPLGAEELVNALATPVSDAVSELESVLDGALHVGITEAIIAEALDFNADAVAVPLHDGDAPVAVLVIDLHPSGDAQQGWPGSDAREAADFTAFVGEPTAPAGRSLDILHDVEMAVTVELGRTRMAVRDLLSLSPGAVVELDRAAGSPVDVLVNGKLIARGEVVVIDDDFGIRISEIIGFQTSRT